MKKLNNLNIKGLGLALGITYAVFYFVACVIFMALPGRNMTIFVVNSLMHGVENTSIISLDIPFRVIVLGLIISFGIGWAMGALIAFLYNTFEKYK